MSRKKIRIPKANLYRLYHIKNNSTTVIAKIYNCNRQTISNRLREFNIVLKSRCQIHMRYPKYNFSRNLIEKAYLIGFRLGDLRVFKPRSYSETIVVQCHTTQYNQVLLLKKLFKRYGKVTVTKLKDGSVDINCYLNETFYFLLPKKDFIESWIYKNRKIFTAFMTGYIDAEGNFIINQGRGRFKIDSYDKNILHKMHFLLNKLKINSKIHLISKKGQLSSAGYRFNSDLWRLNINESGSLCKFINIIKPFLRHRKRIKNMKEVLSNIKIRKQKGTIS